MNLIASQFIQFLYLPLSSSLFFYRKETEKEEFNFIMNNHAGRNVLKVDTISTPLRNNQFLILYNVNVPYAYLQQDDVTRGVLERIKNLLVQDFEHYPVVYQITASYILTHSITAQSRVWTGSFSVRDNVPAQLSGFDDFDPNTFVDDSLDHLEDFEARLVRAPELSSNWVMTSVISIIFNIQAVVDSQSGILRYFPRDGRRAHRTFPLP